MNNELREVFRSFNVVEADLIAANLSSAGMHPVVHNAQSAISLEGGGIAGGGVRVFVPEVEYEDAAQLIDPDRPPAA